MCLSSQPPIPPLLYAMFGLLNRINHSARPTEGCAAVVSDVHSPQPWEMKQKGSGQSRRRCAWFHPRAGRRFWCSLALVADRSGMAVWRCKRRIALTPVRRCLSALVQAMVIFKRPAQCPRGRTCFVASHRVSLGGLALSMSCIMKYHC